jgi:NAD(P)-dependent dehydrogenase (short-subunit alcohol dehydrogenase family)
MLSIWKRQESKNCYRKTDRLNAGSYQMKMKVSDLLKLATASAGALIAARSLKRRLTQFEVQGRVVLITGGSRGLGLVLAREFAAEGARIAICARDEAELDRARIDLENRDANVLALKCDVTVNSEVVEMIRRVHSHFGRIDVLVNNAGIIQVGPLDLMTREDFRRAMNTHFWGPLNTTLAVLPGMRRRNEGRISIPHLVPYSVSKFALVGLSKGLRAELAKNGILVTTVCPGLMRTGSPRNADFKGRHRAEYAWFSISDALPFTSIKAERAARQIIDACKRGRAELVISVQARAAATFDFLFPELSAGLLAGVNRLLPKSGGLEDAQAKGRESTSVWSPSWLTTLNEQAALENNEIP